MTLGQQQASRQAVNGTTTITTTAGRRNRETHAQAFLATIGAIGRLDRTDDFIVRVRRMMVRRVIQLGRHVDCWKESSSWELDQPRNTATEQLSRMTMICAAPRGEGTVRGVRITSLGGYGRARGTELSWSSTGA